MSIMISKRMEEELRVARNQFQPGFVQKGGALPHPSDDDDDDDDDGRMV